MGIPEVTANRFDVLQARRLQAGRQVLANAFILLGVPARKAGSQHDEISGVNAEMLTNASSVVITPGYGMAVAQAQYPVAELAHQLRERGVNVKFGIHPVVGSAGVQNPLFYRDNSQMLFGDANKALRRSSGRSDRGETCSPTP